MQIRLDYCARDRVLHVPGSRADDSNNLRGSQPEGRPRRSGNDLPAESCECEFQQQLRLFWSTGDADRPRLRNTLVLIAPLDSKLRDFQGLAGSSVRVIALGDPASVPAGQYGKQTIVALHLWDQLNPKFVLAKDVRQVLTYVETGNADAGLVYATDAQASSKVRVVATAPESSHDAIVYPAAVVKGSHSKDAAQKFVDYLGSPAARAIFVKHGFTIAAP